MKNAKNQSAKCLVQSNDGLTKTGRGRGGSVMAEKMRITMPKNMLK